MNYLVVRAGVNRIERRFVSQGLHHQFINFDGLRRADLVENALPAASWFRTEFQRQHRLRGIILSGDVFADYEDAAPMRVPELLG